MVGGKIQMKKKLSLLCLVVCFSLLAGCSFLREEADVALDKALYSLQFYNYRDDRDISPLEYYWGDDFYEKYKFEKEPLKDVNIDDLVLYLTMNLKYDIKEINIDRKEAIAKIEITVTDISKLDDTLIDALYMEVMENEKENKSYDDIAFSDVFMLALRIKDIPTYTKEIEIKMTSTISSWKIQNDEELLDILYGGYFTEFDSLYNRYISKME